MKLLQRAYHKVGIAVSGGIDSMTLLDLLRQECDFVVLHVEHGIRGEASLGDAAFVEAYCERNGYEFRCFHVDAPAYAAEHGVSLEVAARELRYGVFDRLLAGGEVDVVALAHHADDNAETVLMRFLRGTGTKGLAGIVDRAGYIHPLLHRTRAEIERYAREHDLPYTEDESNADLRFTRNFIRHRLLPLIETRFPNVRDTLCRTAERFEEVDRYLADAVTPSFVRGDAVVLPLAALDNSPVLAKKSLAEAAHRAGASHDLGHRNLEALRGLNDLPNGSGIDLPGGFRATREYDGICFRRVTPEGGFAPTPFDADRVYRYGGAAYRFEPARTIERGLTFDPDKLPSGAVIRLREDGDRFRRCGGKQKLLSDYLSDAKIPRAERDRMLVLAGGHTVYAVLGLEISESVKVDPTTTKILKVYKENDYETAPRSRKNSD